VEPVVRSTNGERRSVGPPLHVDPPDGPVGVPLARMARAAGVAWSPPARLFADPFGRYSGGLGDGGALGVAAHGLKGPQHRLMALHIETDFHGPSLLRRRAHQFQHFASVIGANNVIPLAPVAQRPLVLVLDAADLEHDLWLQASHVSVVELALAHTLAVGEHLAGRLDLPHLARER